MWWLKVRKRDAGCGADARDALDSEGTQRRRGRRGRGGLRGGFCDNTTACRCLGYCFIFRSNKATSKR